MPHNPSVFLQYLTNTEYLFSILLLQTNPHWWSPEIASTYEMNLEEKNVGWKCVCVTFLHNVNFVAIVGVTFLLLWNFVLVSTRIISLSQVVMFYVLLGSLRWNTWGFIALQLLNNNFNSKRIGPDTNGLAVCIFSPWSIIDSIWALHLMRDFSRYCGKRNLNKVISRL
jgi:hypothetical protein